MKKFLLIICLLVIALFIIATRVFNSESTSEQKKTIIPTNSPAASLSSPDLPKQKILQNNYHIFQSFNNCGPASLSMLLSYYGINKSQQELASELRPYNNPEGINDDKSVTLDELAEKAQGYGLLAYHRPAGNLKLIKQFIAADIPVLTRTWLHLNEDIGHYRIVKGYDDTAQEIIQDDSFEDKNLRYSYADFNELWKKFNYEYVVLVPKDKQKIAEEILGESINTKKTWNNAVQLSLQELHQNPDDIYARFNLSVAYHNIGDHQSSVEAFEKVEDKLPFRTLWYQLEPVDSYFQLGNYQRVFEITEKIISNQNKAYSEAYFLRGQAYLKLSQTNRAKEEFEKAVFYNKNYSAKIPQL